MAYDVPGAGYFVEWGGILNTEGELSGTLFSIRKGGEWKRRKEGKGRESNIYYNLLVLGTALTLYNISSFQSFVVLSIFLNVKDTSSSVYPIRNAFFPSSMRASVGISSEIPKETEL